MKKGILFVFLIFAIILKAQENKTKNKFGVEFQLNSGDFIVFPLFIKGAASISSEGSQAFGINYSYQFKDRFWFETAVLYQKVKVEITAAPIGIPSNSYPAEIQWFEIPFQIRRDLTNWFYLKGGLNLVFETKKTSTTIDDQSGLGVSGGFGFDIKAYNAYHIELEPGLKVFSVVSFATSGGQRHYFSPTLSIRFTYRK